MHDAISSVVREANAAPWAVNARRRALLPQARDYDAFAWRVA
jgi:hypothetical protein